MNEYLASFSFDFLDSTKFEQFCFDLLREIGFSNLNWRKGTGLSSSPSDQGRDIECEYISKSPIDGRLEKEKWFVECKHHRQGVPPEKLQSILSWAQAERPNKVLIIVSNFLSNPAKEYIEHYREKNKPAFDIVIWEKPKFEELMATRSKLLRKYGLAGDFPYLSLLHPAHIKYLKLPLPNTLNYLFQLLDNLDSEKRTDIMDYTFFSIVNPQFRDLPPDYKGTIGDLIIDKVDYQVFKEKCWKLVDLIPEHFLVSAIINDVLQYLFNLGDITSVDIFIHRYDAIIEKFTKEIEEGNPDVNVLRDMITDLKARKRRLPENARKSYELYQYFCEHVVSKLFDEEIDSQLQTFIKRLKQR